MKIELTVEEIKRICVALDCFGDKRAEIQGDAYGIQYWRIRDKLKKYIEVNENKKMTEAEKAALEDWGQCRTNNLRYFRLGLRSA